VLVQVPRSPGALVALTAASAALQAAAFPPLALFPLAWVALVPLLAALARTGPLGGLGLGLLWSLLVGLGTSSWLPRMITDYFGASPAGGWLAAACATLATGCLYGVFGAWWAWLARRRPPSPLATALLWGACEYARTVAPLANPWVLSGYSQVRFTALAQVADVAGVVGIGMLLAAGNAAIAGLLDPRAAARRPRAAAAATAGVFAAALLYGGWRLAQPFGEGEEVRVALVQSAIARERRFEPRFRNANLADHVDLVAHAARAGPDLILLSELAVDVPFHSGSREANLMGRIAAQASADVLVGAPAALDLLVFRRQFNSFFVLRGPEIVDRYDKVELAPFSESKPLRWLDVGEDAYAAGRDRRPLASRAGPVGVLLCSEAMVGRIAREAVLRGAEILANPANDSWFANAAAARMQLDVAALRAIETRRWLVRPTLTGYTAVVDPYGRVTAEAAFGRPDILHAAVRRGTTQTFYTRFGDVAGRAALAGALALSVASAVASRGRSRRRVLAKGGTSA
jgi:apolipoprotein N-acyltransferase